MIIRKIGIDGFGKFHRNAFEFEPGINLIYGENEAGKTTLEQFLIGMLYDVEKLRGKGAKHDVYNRYYPEYGGKYGGIMEFELDENVYRVQRTFRRDQKDLKLYDLMIGREVIVEKELFDTCGFMTKNQFMETLCMNPGKILTGNYLKEELNRYSHRFSSAGTTQFDVEEAIRQLFIKKRKNQKKQSKEEMMQLKSQFMDSNEIEKKRETLVLEQVHLERLIKQLKEDLLQKQSEIEEEKKKELLAQYEREKEEERQSQKEESEVNPWIQEEGAFKQEEFVEKKQHSLEQWNEEDEDDFEDEFEDDFDDGMEDGLGLSITALICFMAGFISIWQGWSLIGIGMIFIGGILLFWSFFKKNQDKNLSDTGSMVQLEDEARNNIEEEVSHADSPYTMLRPEFLELEEHIKKEVETLAYNSESSLLLKKEEEIIQAKVVDCEKKLLENRMKQKNLLEEEQRNQEMRIQYESLKQEMQKIEYENRATDLAIATLRELSASIYHEFGNIFNEKVSEIVRKITDERYQRVMIDDQMEVQVERNGRFLGLDQMSLGTVEQIYFGIRIAASQLFQRGDSLPILIDDALGSFDGERLGRTLKFLSECSNRQVFVFTCNSRIRDILINQQTDFSYLEL